MGIYVGETKLFLYDLGTRIYTLITEKYETSIQEWTKKKLWMTVFKKF